jgi:small subunit ribosomal protein S6
MHYELIYILPGTLAETEVQTATEKIKGMMTEMGASDMVVTEIGKNRLAYPMNHIRYGYFFITRFAAEQSAVEGIKEKLRLSGEILRMMITTYDPKNPTEPKINYPTQTVAAGKDLTMPELADAPVAIHAREEKKVAEKPVVSMEEIGEKLDEILDKDIVV